MEERKSTLVRLTPQRMGKLNGLCSLLGRSQSALVADLLDMLPDLPENCDSPEIAAELTRQLQERYALGMAHGERLRALAERCHGS